MIFIQSFRFIDNYGTHYIKQADMGALFGEQTMISTESYNKMVSDGVNVGLYAGFSAMANVNSSFGWNATESEYFYQYTKEQQIYSKGAIPPSNLKPLDWMKMTYEEPMTMRMKVASIDTLPNIEGLVSAPVLKNLKKALKNYCPALLEAGKLSSCDPPEDNPPLPKPRTWTKWATEFHSHLDEEPVIECPEGQYVTQMQFKRIDRLNNFWISIQNFRLKCSGKNFSQFSNYDFVSTRPIYNYN